jgi:hypothetical protein
MKQTSTSNPSKRTLEEVMGRIYSSPQVTVGYSGTISQPSRNVHMTTPMRSKTLNKRRQACIEDARFTGNSSIKMTKCKTVLKLDVKKSTVKLNNLNLNINFTYLDDTTASKGATQSSVEDSEVKKNLFPLLETTDDLENLLHVQKSKYTFNEVKKKVTIVQQEESLEDKLNYIFDKEKNVKTELKKLKFSNSCRCGRTNCTKYYCNCLRNGIKCDILCSCKNCNNKTGLMFLNKKIKR